MSWALILGASSGFGAATALELARAGYDVFGVHLDRRSTLPAAEKAAEAVRQAGRRVVYINANAADPEKRREVLDTIEKQLTEDGTPGGVGVLMHSLAFGTLRPFVAGGESGAVTQAQMEMTLDVMANSLVYWTRELVWRGLMTRGGRVFAMTSAGSTHAILNYGAVSAAKAALEAHVRQLAFELAPQGISVNAIRAGVTDTAALRKIPGNEAIVERGLRINPSGRITTTEDVARAIAALCNERLAWMTGNVIGVDGGEEISGG
jgi:enoyl-[acyl-carrier protein] reductase III